MALQQQVAELISKVGTLQTTLGAEVTELKTAFDALKARIAELEGIDLSPQINAISDAIAGVSALSDLSITADTEIPSTPGAPVATNLTSSSVDLTWAESTDNAGVTGYEVFQNGEKVMDSTSTTAIVTGLTPETNYVFAVRAKDAAGNFSALGEGVSVTTPA